MGEGEGGGGEGYRSGFRDHMAPFRTCRSPELPSKLPELESSDLENWIVCKLPEDSEFDQVWEPL